MCTYTQKLVKTTMSVYVYPECMYVGEYICTHRQRHVPGPPNVPLFMALWSLLVGPTIHDIDCSSHTNGSCPHALRESPPHARASARPAACHRSFVFRAMRLAKAQRSVSARLKQETLRTRYHIRIHILYNYIYIYTYLGD